METTSQRAWRVENINLNAAKSGCIEGVAKLNASFPSNKGPENYFELLGMDPYSSLCITPKNTLVSMVFSISSFPEP